MNNKDLPIYDLEFDENEVEGIYGISLVSDPAIDIEFIKFSKTEIECNCSKSNDDISPEIVDYVLSKGEKIDLDEWQLIDSIVVEDESDTDVKFSNLPNQTDGDSSQDNEIFKIRYEYSPLETSSNSRDFCIKMVSSGLVYKKEDLEFSNANPGFGPHGVNSYNLFKFKGGPFCVHKFERRIYFNKNQKKLSLFEALQEIKGLNKSDLKKAVIEQNPEEVSQKASASNNYWRLSTEEMKFSVTDKEKRILTSPVLIPEQLIYRDFDGGCYVKASAKTIEDLQVNFFKKKYQNNSTIEHNDDNQIEDITFFESWTITDPLNDKANALGFKNLPKGTLMMSAKLSQNTWDEYVKTGKVKGFSIDSKLGINKKQTKKQMNYSSVKKAVLAKILLESELKEFKISDDLTIKAGSLEMDQVIFNVDDSPLVSASFVFEQKKYDTDENGVIVNIEDAPVEEKEVEAAEEDAKPDGDLQAKLDEALAKVEALEVENSDLKAELEKVKSEAVKLAKSSNVPPINTKVTKVELEKMSPLELYRYKKSL
ncbi:MAG: XkdF-like putative serine protease domain-containing protein [Bacteroidota bacterium]